MGEIPKTGKSSLCSIYHRANFSVERFYKGNTMKCLTRATLTLMLATLPLYSLAAPTTFATCLKEKSVVMYSAWWCPYCFIELRQIDPSFVDRSGMRDAKAMSLRFPFLKECGGASPGRLLENCVPASVNKETGEKISGVPTTALADDTLNIGALDLEELASFTGCPLP